MSDAHDQERLMTALSTHWVKYLPQALFCHGVIAVAALLIFLAFVSAPYLSTVAVSLYFVGVIAFLYAHHAWFHKVMSEELYDIIITDHRIIYFDDRLFLCDNEHEIPLHKIASVDVQQEGLLMNAFNYGTLRIDTGGGAVDLRRSIPNVPRPEEVAQIITGMTS